jgi:TetR/AcrR family transcriptional regulator, transcriptional repressor for nem operon
MAPVLFKSATRKGNELAAICGGAGGRRPGDAIALMVICVGGMPLGRAVHGKDFPARNLRVAREIAGTVAGAGPSETAD